jgi:hypothetical protein
MTDLGERIRAANPVDVGSLGRRDVEGGLDAALAALARGDTQPGRRAPRLLTGGALAAGAGAAVAVMLVLTSGGAIATASAFPILRTHGVDIRHRIGIARSSAGVPVIPLDLADAHPFAMPSTASWTGQGFVVPSEDGSEICLLLMGTNESSPTAGRPVLASRQCATNTDAEQQGLVGTLPYWPSGPDTTATSPGAAFDSPQREFAALVPAGAGVSLTDGGTTTALPVDGGIATGVGSNAATVTITVNGQTYSQTLAGAGTAGGAGSTAAGS